MKLLFNINTGWAIRNYVQTGVLSKLAFSCELIIITKIDYYEFLVDALNGLDVKIKIIKSFDETHSWRFLRQIKKKIHLERFQSTTEQVWEEHVSRPLYQRIGGQIIRRMGRLIGYERLFLFFEYFGIILIKNNHIENIIYESDPDLIFLTHQSNPYDEQIYYIAKIKGIKLIYMVLSWDHLSSKVYLGSYFYKIFVWNKCVAREILNFSRYNRKQIEIVGIPQFDVYDTLPSLSYIDWCQQFNFDPNKKTILFSTMPQIRHDQQHIIIEEIVKKINSGYIKNSQLLIKCHPFDDWNVYSHIVKKYCAIVQIIKSEVKSSDDQDKWIPSQNFMFESRDALFYCSVNINIFSTITIEAAIFDKPIINIGFDPKPELVKDRIPCLEYYKFNHFAPIIKLKASTLVLSEYQLYNEINAALAYPSSGSVNRRILVKEYVPKFKSGSAFYLACRILNILYE